MNFSLTFNDLRVNGSYLGNGKFISYVPLRGKGNYNFNINSKLKIINFTYITKINWKFNFKQT